MTFVPEGPGAVLIDGYPLAYRRAGEGPPLVLVHGMISDHGLWDVHLPKLADQFHVITPTLRYFGASPWPDQGQGFSMDRQAEDLGAFIEALGLGPVHLAGWSLGAALALCLAAKRPRLIKTLLLYEPSLMAGVTDPDDLEQAAKDRDEMFAEARSRFGAQDGIAAIEAFVDGANGRAGTFQSFSRAMQRVFERNARPLAPFFAGPPPPRITAADIDAIETPARLALGEESRPFWQICVPEIAKRMPSARLLRLAGCRHMWPAEAPDEFSGFVIDSLKTSAEA